MPNSRQHLFLFFLLAYFLTWSCWLPLAWSPSRLSDQAGLLYLLGGLGPLASALIIAAYSGGRAALNDLASRLFRWRVHPIWYLLAVLLIPVLVLLANYAAALILNTHLKPPRWSEMLSLFALLTIMISIEEVGWRGFAIPPTCNFITAPSPPASSSASSGPPGTFPSSGSKPIAASTAAGSSALPNSSGDYSSNKAAARRSLLNKFRTIY